MSRHLGVPSLGESLQSSHFVAFYVAVGGSVCDSSSYACGYGQMTTLFLWLTLHVKV